MKRLLILFTAALLASAATHAASSAELLKKAKAAFKAGDYEAATALYESIAETNPRVAMWAFWNMGRVAQARAAAEAVLRETPDDAEATRMLGWSLLATHRDEIRDLQAQAKAAYQAGNTPDAIAAHQRILTLDPDNILISRDLMWLLWNAKRRDEAKAVAEKILALHPDDREASSLIRKHESLPVARAPQKTAESDAARRRKEDRLRARALYTDGRYEEAEKALTRLLDEKDDEPALWYQLGRTQMALKNYRDAINSLERSLKLDHSQPDVAAALGKSYVGSRDLKKGVVYLEEAVRTEGAVKKNALPNLAKALYYEGDYRRSYQAWSQAAAANNDRADYRFREAEALFYAGDKDEALKRMRTLLEKRNEPLSARFLIDNALARRDNAAAVALLERSTKDLSAGVARDVLRLANLYLVLNQPEKSLDLLGRWTRQFPSDVPSLLARASVLRQMERSTEGARAYEAVLQRNPAIVEAWIGLSDCLFRANEPERGLLALREARKAAPRDPFVLRRLARRLAETGATDEARRLLAAWIDKNAGAPTLPILLYHGLTPVDGAPMLAYQEHMTVKTFTDQMSALAQAGFHPVTIAEVAAWSSGKGALPEKPVFITFDDARVDGFANADPVLAKFKLKATMFVPLDNVEAQSAIGFATWDTIERYRDNGRWEIESHGAHAHSRIPISEDGREALSLVMPRWLSDDGRPETATEWRVRVESDHATSRRVIEERTGRRPIGFAYAEGQFGQRSDAAEAVPLNIAAVKKYYRLAFVQDDFGVSARTEDPHFLRRVEPDNSWTGAALLQRLAAADPVRLIMRDAIAVELRDRRPAAARAWLERLRAAGAPDDMLVPEEARVAFASEDYVNAQRLARRALTSGPDASMERILEDIDDRMRVTWQPGVSYERDSQGRDSWGQHQEVTVPLSARLSLVGSQRFEHHRERDTSDVDEIALGAGVATAWARRHDAAARLFFHSLSGGEDLFGYTAHYRFRPSDNFFLRGQLVRRPYGSARALRQNVHEEMTRVDAQWGRGDWGLFSRGRLSEISGANQRRGADVDFRWPLWAAGRVGPVFHIGVDDMRRDDPRYYSPRRLRSADAGLQFSAQAHPALKVLLRYMPGVAKEDGTDSVFAQSLVGRLRWALAPRTALEPALSYQKTANYHNTGLTLDVEHRF